MIVRHIAMTIFFLTKEETIDDNYCLLRSMKTRER